MIPPSRLPKAIWTHQLFFVHVRQYCLDATPAFRPHYFVMDIVIGPTERSTALTLSVDEAATLSGLGRHTVRDAVAAGSLPVIRVGRVIRISRIALEQWLAKVAEQGVDLADYRAARRSCWLSNRHVIQGHRS